MKRPYQGNPHQAGYNQGQNNQGQNNQGRSNHRWPNSFLISAMISVMGLAFANALFHLTSERFIMRAA